eukprot:scaffold7684_cov119-Isochrysis_galbana.AAC.9
MPCRIASSPCRHATSPGLAVRRCWKMGCEASSVSSPKLIATEAGLENQARSGPRRLLQEGPARPPAGAASRSVSSPENSTVTAQAVLRTQEAPKAGSPRSHERDECDLPPGRVEGGEQTGPRRGRADGGSPLLALRQPAGQPRAADEQRAAAARREGQPPAPLTQSGRADRGQQQRSDAVGYDGAHARGLDQRAKGGPEVRGRPLDRVHQRAGQLAARRHALHEAEDGEEERGGQPDLGAAGQSGDGEGGDRHADDGEHERGGAALMVRHPAEEHATHRPNQEAAGEQDVRVD